MARRTGAMLLVGTILGGWASPLLAVLPVPPLKAELPALHAAAQTADDKYTAGQVTYSLGAKLKDIALQRQGVDMMIGSGSSISAGERPGQIFAAAQLAYQDKLMTYKRLQGALPSP